MPDYNKQTVAQLRQLLKDRSIPSTGLTRKAQIIEKLEEADGAGTNAPDAIEGSEEHKVAAPVTEEIAGDNSNSTPGMLADKRFSEVGADLGSVSEVQPASESAAAPVPVTAPTSSSLPEPISHIDSDAPVPDPIKAIEHPAEDTTMDQEPGSIEPANVFNAPPADPEDVVEPRVTEPAEPDTQDQRILANSELPDAPGPAAEALRFARNKTDGADNSNLLTADNPIASPIPNEQPSVERTELLPIPERSTAETSRLNTEELEADSRKRKRRSLTPELPSQDIRAKKHRPSQEPVPEVYLKEDRDLAMKQAEPEDHSELQVKEELPVAEADSKREKKEKTARYKDLMKSGADDTPMEAIVDDRPTQPALHPVTAALYIRNFMRPLRPEPLRAHLASLATAPASSPDQSIVKSLFLDAMKTHALVLFSSTNSASRVRASLHGSIWPPEGNRKELWVDFIPDDLVEDWIKEEEDAIVAEKEARANGRSLPPKRFEVVYPESIDGSITAIFQEVGSSAPSNAPRGPRANIDTRRTSTQQSGIPVLPSKDTRQDIEASFKTLDELFSSTVAKPQLFYLPVSDEISDLRRKELDIETSRDWAPGQVRKGRGIKTEMKYKYSFDDQDRVVEVGEDRGPWSEAFRGGRGGGLRGRGRGGGGYRGRGGDTWRG